MCSTLAAQGTEFFFIEVMPVMPVMELIMGTIGSLILNSDFPFLTALQR